MLHDTEMSLGSRIKECRLEMKLTQEGLAKLIGCNRVSVTNWERDRNEPDRDSFLALAEVFRVNQKWLMDGDRNGTIPKRSVDIRDAVAITPAPPRTGRDVMNAAEPAARYAGASDKAKQLADTILACSGDGYISDDVIDAMFTMVNATHAAIPDSLLDEIKGGNNIKQRG